MYFGSCQSKRVSGSILFAKILALSVNMQVSVIIPVFNAERFVKKAAESAVCHDEVGEVILIEDDSEDESLSICRKLQTKHKKIRLLRHHDRKNHGAGATRNLGVKNAVNPLIAFLDADDFYLPGRFTIPFGMLKNNDHIDGVYEAIGIQHYNSNNELIVPSKNHKLTSLAQKVNPDKLFDALVKNGLGSLHLDGLTVRKDIFDKYGYFNENLRLHQDSTWIIQMSSCATLAAGRLNEPVAMRGVHAGNRFFNNTNLLKSKARARKHLFYWSDKNKLEKRKRKALFYNYILALFLACIKKELNISDRLLHFSQLVYELIKNPLFFSSLISQYRERSKNKKIK
jgi:glycosyltransferase involved in cell wall biosynthesis